MKMAISETSGASGVVVAAEIQELVHELSKELGKDERDVRRDARAAELAKGLEAAEDLHDKATSTRNGAYISGICTMGSAGFQVGAATQIGSSKDWADFDLKCADTSEKFGNEFNQLFTAKGTDAEARSAAAQALGKSYGHQADEAGDDLRDVKKLDDSVNDLLKQVTDSEHGAIMAILSRR
jgi:hypothetical protein